MAKNCLFLSIILVMIFTLSACAPAEEGVSPRVEVGIIPDPDLAAVIRYALREPEGEIFPSDLEQLTMLRAEVADLTEGGVQGHTRFDVSDLQIIQEGIADLTGLEYCINLEGLWLSQNHLTDKSQLDYLTKLERLEIENNRVTDISPLTPLTKLIWLKLNGNQISDISPLVSLTDVETLALDQNQITDISPLASLPKLIRLWLNGNQISDISALAGLTEIRELRLHGNNITDISPLVENSGLAEGDILTLMNNPLDETSVEVYIPQLRDRGVKVSW